VKKSKTLLYAALVAVMAYSATQLDLSKVFAQGPICCSYGVDCSGKGKEAILKCCTPSGGEAPCSQQQPNYCRDSCG
jgi:hypothetical protein